MATLATQRIALPSLTPTYASATSGGDAIAGGPNVFLHVKNGGGSSINVTLTPVTYNRYGILDSAIVIAVPAAGERMIPIPSILTNATTSLVPIAYSAVTTVTVAAITT